MAYEKARIWPTKIQLHMDSFSSGAYGRRTFVHDRFCHRRPHCRRGRAFCHQWDHAAHDGFHLCRHRDRKRQRSCLFQGGGGFPEGRGLWYGGPLHFAVGGGRTAAYADRAAWYTRLSEQTGDDGACTLSCRAVYDFLFRVPADFPAEGPDETPWGM